MCSSDLQGCPLERVEAHLVDLKVDKVRFDAFQWTSLEPLLRGLAASRLMICGVVTNLCVETTVRSAFMRDFPVTLIEDACAAKTRRLHDLSIEVLSSYELAEIVRVGDGFDAGDPQRSNYFSDWNGREELARNCITGG